MAMNAFEIVDLLLEADQYNSGVYIFGPDLPVNGYPAPSVEKAIENFRRYGLIDPQTRDAVELMDQLVGMGYTFFFKKYPGEVEVVGKVPVRTTPEGQERASQYLGLERHTKVQYRSSTQGNSQQMDVDYVLFGSKELEQQRKEQEQQRKEKRSVQTRELGKIDPKEEGFKAPPTGVGYKEPEDMMPLDAPLQVGFTFDPQQKDGIHVVEVHPSGPAAQAGVQAGDVILQAGKYARKDGKPPKSYMLSQPLHLEYVLRTADPRYAIPFRVIRGDAEYWLPILPTERQKYQSSDIHIPAAEVQGRFSRGSAPASQAYPAPKKAKQRILGLRQPKAGPTQRRLPLKYPPNEPSPARETGNPPANVSSLT